MRTVRILLLMVLALHQWQSVVAFGNCPEENFEEWVDTPGVDMDGNPRMETTLTCQTTESAGSLPSPTVNPQPTFVNVTFAGSLAMAQRTRREYEFTNIRAPKFKINWSLWNSAMGMFLYEDDMFHSEHNLQFTDTVMDSKPGRTGKWKVAIAMGNGYDNIAFDELSVSVFCTDGKEFASDTGNPTVKVCTTPVPPSPPEEPPAPPTPPTPPAPPASEPAGRCAYSVVGFNPWNRFNVFGLSDGIAFTSATVDGRVGAANGLTATNSRIHEMQHEPLVALGTPNWSVTAKGQVSVLSGSVILGGVEAGGSVTVDGATTSVGGDVHSVSSALTISNGGIVNGAVASKEDLVGPVPVHGFTKTAALALSVDVDAVVDYFTTRSTVWADHEQSVISFTQPTAQSPQIRIRMHGKVNFVNDLTIADLTLANLIILEGNPAGTVIVNLKGDEAPVELSPLRVVFRGREQADNEAVAPAFGRVLLNFVDASKGLDLSGIGTEQNPAVVSVLAPLSTATATAGTVVKGNVIVKGLTSSAVHLAQPFGTRNLPGVQGPKAPRKPWSVDGKRATECLWHAL